VLGDWLAVLLTLLGIRHRFGQTIFDDAQTARGHAQPAAD